MGAESRKNATSGQNAKIYPNEIRSKSLAIGLNAQPKNAEMGPDIVEIAKKSHYIENGLNNIRPTSNDPCKTYRFTAEQHCC